MKVRGRLLAMVVVLAVIGLGAYVWFVSVPSWSCAEESEESERALAEYLTASKLIQSPRATQRPPSGRDIDEYLDRLNAALDEIARDHTGIEAVSERYFSAAEKHLECQTEDKSIF